MSEQGNEDIQNRAAAMLRGFVLCCDSGCIFGIVLLEYRQAGRFLHGELFRPWIAKEGGDRMTDYEMLMIVLMVLSLVVVLITKDRK